MVLCSRSAALDQTVCHDRADGTPFDITKAAGDPDRFWRPASLTRHSSVHRMESGGLNGRELPTLQPTDRMAYDILSSDGIIFRYLRPL